VTLRQRLRDADFKKTTILLAIIVIPVIIVIVLGVSAFSGQWGVPPVVLPGNDTGDVPYPTGMPDVTNTPEATPAPTPVPTPHQLRVVTGADVSPVPGGAWQDAGMAQLGGKAARHIAYAYQTGVSGIADFTAYWTVPPRPAFNGIQNHTIFLWAGIQQGNEGLVQAVLEWDHDDTGRYWTLACWAVNKRDQTHEVSSRIRVNTGDRIRAELRYEDDVSRPGQKVWHIIMTDEKHGQVTELFDSGRAVNTNDDVTVFCSVLEGIGYVYSYIDLPGDVTFDDFTLRDEGGKVMPLYLGAYVDPAFPAVAVEYEDHEGGRPVIIHTGY
jgi:hypothetical protein